MSSGCVYMHPFGGIGDFVLRYTRRRILYSYRRGLSALLVRQYRAMREASMSGTGSKNGSHVFFYARVTLMNNRAVLTGTHLRIELMSGHDGIF